MIKKIFALVGLTALWWFFLYTTYKCYDFPATLLSFFTSGIGALGIVIYDKLNEGDNGNDNTENNADTDVQ